MNISWLSLIPPVIVIISAFLTRKLVPSLILGIVSAGLIATDFSIAKSLHLIWFRLWYMIMDIEKAYLYGFLLAIASLISLFAYTGCAVSFAQMITKKIKNARAAQRSSILVSFMVFVDDYLSILTTGYVMGSLMDQFRIPREKLAFLVHSLAGPLVILVPVSSWVAALTSYLTDAGVDINHSSNIKVMADPFYIYLKSIPFIFYSFLIIASVLFIIQKHISYGPMQLLEEKEKHYAKDTSSKEPESKQPSSNSNVIWDLIIPLFVLISFVLIGIPYAGGFWLFGGPYTLVESFQHNDHTFLIMFLAGILSLVTGLGLALFRKSIAISKIPFVFVNGFKLMYGAIIVVFLASILGDMLKNDVKTGYYLASLLHGTVNIGLLPLLFYLISLLTTLVTGSAWGTFALMLSIAVPMITTLMNVAIPASPAELPILFPVLGAIFSGAVCGDHVSPLSETTIMTATSTQVNPITHATTQFPYALPALVSTGLSFLISGFLIDFNPWINIAVSLGIGLIVCFSLLYILNRTKKVA